MREPIIISRQAWGARPPKSPIRPLRDFADGWFWHWNGPAVDMNPGAGALLRADQRYHQDSKGWVDLAYHFAIWSTGTIYEGRGWGRQGAATLGRNESSMAILFMIGLGQRPTAEMIASAESLMAYGTIKGFGNTLVRPHNSVVATQCPGPDLTAYLAARTHPPTNQELPAVHQRYQNLLAIVDQVAGEPSVALDFIRLAYQVADSPDYNGMAYWLAQYWRAQDRRSVLVTMLTLLDRNDGRP